MRDRAATAALSALVVVSLVAVVAIASTGSTPGGSDATREPSEAIFDMLFTLGLVAVVAGAILLVYGLTQRRAIAAEVATGKYPRMSLPAFLVFLGLFTALTSWRMSKWQVPEQPAEEDDLLSAGEQLVPALPDGSETTYEPSISWIPIVVVVGLVVAAGVAYFVAERRRRRSRAGAERTLVEQLALVLEETLDDLRAEADPRRAIIAAYARLERVLAANGTARLASETPDEYLPRVLRSLEIDPAAISRLTALYTRAKFSQHDVDAGMKDEAIDALGQVRDELRQVREAPPSSVDTMPPVLGAAS